MCGICGDSINCPETVPCGHCALTILGIISDTFNYNPEELLGINIINESFKSNPEEYLEKNYYDKNDKNDSVDAQSRKRKIKIEIDKDVFQDKSIVEPNFTDKIIDVSLNQLQFNSLTQTANEITRQLLWLSYNERNNLSLDNRECKSYILKRTKTTHIN